MYITVNFLHSEFHVQNHIDLFFVRMNFVVFLLLACWCFCSFSHPLATVSLCGLLCDWCSSRLCLVLLHVVCLPGTSTVLYLSFITPVLLYFLVFLYIPRSPFHLFSSFSLLLLAYLFLIVPVSCFFLFSLS